MATNDVLPADDEVDALVPGPGSVTWERAGDARMFIAAGYALTIQTAHPTVGAGVAEHSNFREDPWGRLMRTLDFTNGLVYGDARTAAGVGRTVREMHKRIKGVKDDGTPYHALEPEAYAWVHITLFDAIVRAHERFGLPWQPGEIERFYGEWLSLGRLLGVRERDLPPTLDGFHAYYDAMIRDRLEANETVYEVLDSLAQPTPPPLPAALRASFRLGSRPLARSARLATIAMLSPLMRERLDLHLTRTQEVELRAFAALARAATPLMPATLRNFGPAYLRWRHAEVERLASGIPSLPDAVPAEPAAA